MINNDLKIELLNVYISKFKAELGRDLTSIEMNRVFEAFEQYYPQLSQDLSITSVRASVEFHKATGLMPFLNTKAEPWYIGSSNPGTILQCWPDGRKMEGRFAKGQFTPLE